MIERIPHQITLPKDTGPHKFANIEWWYYFAFLNGEQGGRYAVMASFFRVGEVEGNKGLYLIYTLIDLKERVKRSYSLIDPQLIRNMKVIYLPVYLLLHPRELGMWQLYKSLLQGQLPLPHTQMKKVTVKRNPTQIIADGNELIFFGEKEDGFRTNLIGKNLKIALQFSPQKPMALVGGNGKPDDLYYYSFTKTRVQGEIQTDNRVEKVIGQGWFDHQWGRAYKSFGWNWFGLQLQDGRELLLNEMRSNKTQQKFSPMANLIEVDGSIRFTRNVVFEELNYWVSEKTKARYPTEWKIIIPEFAMELQVKAIFPKQEMMVLGPLQAIWEGACNLIGWETSLDGNRRIIVGEGFMELVGIVFVKL